MLSPIGSITSTSRTPPGRSTAGRASSARTSTSAIRAAAGTSARPAADRSTSRRSRRALNAIGYDGPLSVEWEDCGMDREYGAAEAARFVKEKMGFASPAKLFDSAFAEARAEK